MKRLRQLTGQTARRAWFQMRALAVISCFGTVNYDRGVSLQCGHPSDRDARHEATTRSG